MNIVITVSEEVFAYVAKFPDLQREFEKSVATIVHKHKMSNVDITSYVDVAGQMRSGTMSEAAVLETVAIERAQKEQHVRDFGNSGPDAVQLRAREGIAKRARNPLGHPEHGNNL